MYLWTFMERLARCWLLNTLLGDFRVRDLSSADLENAGHSIASFVALVGLFEPEAAELPDLAVVQKTDVDGVDATAKAVVRAVGQRVVADDTLPPEIHSP